MTALTTHAKVYSNIAEMCHILNCAFCDRYPDPAIPTAPPWADLDEHTKDSVVDGVVAAVRHLKAGEEPDPSESHQNWLKFKEADGWKYGTVKDAAKKEHPCMVPYDKLPEAQKQKDDNFIAVVKAAYAAGVFS